MTKTSKKQTLVFFALVFIFSSSIVFGNDREDQGPPKNIMILGASMTQGWGGAYARVGPLSALGLGNRSPSHQIVDEINRHLPENQKVYLIDQSQHSQKSSYHRNIIDHLPTAPKSTDRKFDLILALDIFYMDFAYEEEIDESLMLSHDARRIRKIKNNVIDTLDRFADQLPVVAAVVKSQK